MTYVSTRGGAGEASFGDILLGGLAPDGGLWMPKEWPQFGADDFRSMRGQPYAEIAARVIHPFVDGWIDRDSLREMARDAYGGFDHPAVAPLVQTADNDWLLELFHGPTFAFKDLALQMLGRLMDRALEEQEERVTILGATSGDTGSAAIAGCAGRRNMDIFILFPKNRVSDVQRRQMTTVVARNVHCLAIEGTFDDCQAMVKAMFNDAAFAASRRLTAVNSINWARIVAQAAYCVASAVRLGAPDRRIAFSIPSANFGACLAAWCAIRMGLPVERLVVATNANDILHRFFETGHYTPAAVTATLSPSMDIQVSSNFERLLFELYRDGRSVERLMARLPGLGTFDVTARALSRARSVISSHRLDDDGIRREIMKVERECGLVIDPHTACGTAAARRVAIAPEVTVVTHAQAHPAKFPEAVHSAIGRYPKAPEALSRVSGLPENMTVLPNDLGVVQAYVSSNSEADG